jgi:hypothetical protein
MLCRRYLRVESVPLVGLRTLRIAAATLARDGDSAGALVALYCLEGEAREGDAGATRLATLSAG